MRSKLIMVAAALIAAAPASAQTEPQSNSQAPAASDNDAAEQQPQGDDAGQRRICVTERLSGSRMPHRVCRTAREWQAQQGDSDER